MRFERTPWRKLYVSESLEHRSLPLFARGLRDYLLRFAEDDGTLLRSCIDPASDLYRTLTVHASEAKLFRSAVRSLIDVGFLQLTSGTLRIVKFQAAQQAHTSNAERQANYRARKAAKSQGPGQVAAADSVTPVVTTVTQPVVTTVTRPVVTAVTSPVTLRVTSPDKIREETKDDDEDLIPDQVSRARGDISSSSSAAETGGGDPSIASRFAMQPGWCLDPKTVATLEVELIPRWAVDRLVPEAVTHYAAGGQVCTESTWNQRVAKWVRREWRDPNRRPRQTDSNGQEPPKPGRTPPELEGWEGWHAPR